MKKSHLIGAMCASFWLLNVLASTVYAVGINGQGTWETTLQARDFDGDANTIEGYYDTVLDITWNNTLVSSPAGEYVAIGDWAGGLNIDGITGWRLPGGSGRNCTIAYSGTDCGYNVRTGSSATIVYSEMASLFYDTLGNLAEFDTNGDPQSQGALNMGPFDFSFAGLVVLTNADPMLFTTNDGQQYLGVSTNYYSTKTVVHSGDVGAEVVPIPASVWLFGSGLLGLIGIARRNKAA